MPIDDTDLHGQRVVVLGGTSGIGLTTAAMAAVAGAHVTVVSNRKASVERALAELPVWASGHAVDLIAVASEYRFLGDLGDIDHLVYTADEALLVSHPLAPVALDERQRARGVLSDRRVGAADRPSGRGLRHRPRLPVLHHTTLCNRQRAHCRWWQLAHLISTRFASGPSANCPRVGVEDASASGCRRRQDGSLVRR
jgi:hypothetical protein